VRTSSKGALLGLNVCGGLFVKGLVQIIVAPERSSAKRIPTAERNHHNQGLGLVLGDCSMYGLANRRTMTVFGIQFIPLSN
jgi:hypothetical protein